MMLHGVCIIIAWNVFITIAPDYYIQNKLKHWTPEPSYVSNFMNYICICSQLPNLIINLISLFSGSGNLVLRIIISLIIVTASCVFTIAFIYVDTSTCKVLDLLILHLIITLKGNSDSSSSRWLLLSSSMLQTDFTKTAFTDLSDLSLTSILMQLFWETTFAVSLSPSCVPW